jgi:queuine/archaeosine tRNA-ribosyltransferase
VSHVRDALARDQAISERWTIAPIVHGRQPELPARVASVAQMARPLLLAVAERELGDGIVARARTVKEIRVALDAVVPDCALHLLGTGNPLSLLVFAIAGANSFDGLEWCQTVTDPDGVRLLHFQQRELVRSLVPEEILAKWTYDQATLLHNLAFYSWWMNQVRDAIRGQRAWDLLSKLVPPTAFEAFAHALT